MKQTDSTKTYAFITCILVIVIVTGLLIYLCIYLTDYTPKDSTTTVTSVSNYTKITVVPSYSSKIGSSASQRIEDDNNDITYASAISLKKADVHTLKKALNPIFTKVVIPA